MSAFDDPFPSLDCHAHVAPDVTPRQVEQLGGALIFAVTRSLAEGAFASQRGDSRIVWGCGVHPGKRSSIKAYRSAEVRDVVQRVALIGEVGLDARGPDRPLQRTVLADIFDAIRGQPVLISLHSTGAASEVLEMARDAGHPGTILHWFAGTDDEVRKAAEAGFYFSVSAAVSDESLRRLPPARVLPETDFPTASQLGGSRPGDTLGLESRLARIWGVGTHEVRRRFFRNLRSVALESGAVDRLPERLQDFLLIA